MKQTSWKREKAEEISQLFHFNKHTHTQTLKFLLKFYIYISVVLLGTAQYLSGGGGGGWEMNQKIKKVNYYPLPPRKRNKLRSALPPPWIYLFIIPE